MALQFYFLILNWSQTLCVHILTMLDFNYRAINIGTMFGCGLIDAISHFMCAFAWMWILALCIPQMWRWKITNRKYIKQKDWLHRCQTKQNLFSLVRLYSFIHTLAFVFLNQSIRIHKMTEFKTIIWMELKWVRTHVVVETFRWREALAAHLDFIYLIFIYINLATFLALYVISELTNQLVKSRIWLTNICVIRSNFSSVIQCIVIYFTAKRVKMSLLVVCV